MKKIIAIILVIVAIAAIYYYTSKTPIEGPGAPTGYVKPATLTGDVSTDLSNLEKENQSDTLDQSELDFGASVNAALE